MPFASVAELPSHVKKYSPKVQRQWMAVFNSTYNKLKKEGKSHKIAERRAFMAANSVLKKRFDKGQNIHKESHSDYMNMLVDNFLGNLKG